VFYVIASSPHLARTPGCNGKVEYGTNGEGVYAGEGGRRPRSGNGGGCGTRRTSGSG